MDYFGILSSWEIWEWCHSMGCPFVSGSKWWTQVSTAVKIWDTVNIPTTQKTWLFSWFCAGLRGSKERILQTLSNIINYEWLTLPLLIARMNTSCRVWWIHCSLQTVASAHGSISGLTAVTGWPEWCKSQSSSFSVSEAVNLFTQWPKVLLSTTAFVSTMQRLLWMLVTDSLLARRNSVTASCLQHTSLTNSTWSNAALVLSETFTTL